MAKPTNTHAAINATSAATRPGVNALFSPRANPSAGQQTGASLSGQYASGLCVLR
jgi:hypothetical protein